MMLKRIALHWQILIAMAVGTLIGAVANQMGLGGQDSGLTFSLTLVSDIFLRLLSMIVIPLVFSSIVVGVGGIGDAKHVGKLGLKTGIYYGATSLIAIVTGLILVNLISPGVGANIDLGLAAQEVAVPTSLWSILTRIVPKNPVQALADFDMVSAIFFAILFGIFSNFLAQEQKKFVMNLFQSVFDVMMFMAKAIIKLAPIGVFALVAKLILNTGLDIYISLGWYVLTVFLALAVHFCITLPLILKIRSGVSPIKYFKAMSPALLTGFSTASSSATLSITMDCATERAKISNKVSSFVLPMGATVNMDGTALYECVAVMFIAQALGFHLDFAAQVTIVVTAFIASIGAAGVPHAGLVMMVIVLDAVGLPLEATGMIWAVDRILDMGRTMTNIWSDSVGTCIIAASEGETPMSPTSEGRDEVGEPMPVRSAMKSSHTLRRGPEATA